jgi:OOP family OmpA-OmpF porin
MMSAQQPHKHSKAEPSPAVSPRLLGLVLLALFSGTTPAAEEYSGVYAGVDLVGLGQTRAEQDGSTYKGKNSWLYGVLGGYNWSLGNAWRVGLEASYDLQHKKKRAYDPAGQIDLGARTFGVSGRIGQVIEDKWYPYARLGVVQLKARGQLNTTNGAGRSIDFSQYSSTAMLAGVGAEYKMAPHWSVGGEYTMISGKKDESLKVNQRNLEFKVRYYLDAEKPVPVLAAAPAVERPAPVVAAPPPPPPALPPAPLPVAMPAQNCSQTLVLRDTVFEFNKAALRPEALREIDGFVGRLQQGYFSGLKVVGHTDRLGSDTYNQVLSEDRAKSVAAYLSRYVPSSAITAIGKGKLEPVTTGCVGDTKTPKLVACLAPDRRTEIIAEGACR